MRGAAGTSPLSAWLEDDPAAAGVRRRLGRAPAVLAPRDESWRAIGPDFETAVEMAAAGLPFHVVADRRADTAGGAERLRAALGAGATVYLPQVHQVLPRLMRLMVALRVAFFGPFREECSFLFLVEGRGRPAMGLHHDGETDGVWLQLQGRRTVTVGPPVPAGAPEDLDDRLAPRPGGRRAGWRTLDLTPGTLFLLPPRTPHRVVCEGRSLAVSLTWKALDPGAAVAAVVDGLAPTRGARPPGPSPAAFRRVVAGTLRRAAAAVADPTALARAYAGGLTAWDVVSGRVDAIPPRSPDRLWTQVPAVVVSVGSRRLALQTPGGAELRLPAALLPLARRLALMPAFSRAEAARLPGLAVLADHGLLADRDLPLRILPEAPAALDGWRFA